MRQTVGFFVAGVLMLILGCLLWATPMGTFSLVTGVFMLVVAVLQSLGVRPQRETLHDIDLGTLALPSASDVVPLAPVLGALVLVISWAIEVIVILAKLCSGGAWPSAEKLWTVTAFTAVVTVYKLTIWKRHRDYNCRSPVLTKFQSLVVIAIVACYLAFGAWLLMPLPL